MMKTTKVAVGKDAVKAIIAGVNAIYEPVRRTLGPKGKNALLYGTYGGNPRITNDGVTIAECIEVRDELVNQVAQSFKEACKRTNERAGDATTTTTVLAGHAINKVFSEVSTGGIGGSGADVMALRRTIIDEGAKIVEALKAQAVKVESLEDLEKIATVSVEDETLGKLIASIVYEVGVDGFVDVTEGFKTEIEHEIIKGMRFPAKVPAKAFVNNPARYEMVADQAPVLVTNYAIDNVSTVAQVSNKIIEEFDIRKFVLMAPGFSDQVLVEIARAIKNNVLIFPVKVPALRTEQFEDVCAYLGATFINKDAGRNLTSIRKEDLGYVEKLIIKDIDAREDAIAIGGRGSMTDAVKERVETLRKAINETRVASHKKLLERRIASLSSAVAVIRVGSMSDAETKYLKLKVDDAVHACKGALEEGYLKGGGQALVTIADNNPDMYLADTLRAPYRQICQNAGVSEMEVGEKVIDNAKAIRLAVEHAVSVTSHLITTDIIVAEERDRSPVEGYDAIAVALERKNRMWAKREGLLLEGNVESEGAYDRMLRGEE
jgi:chaperonin GroEL